MELSTLVAIKAGYPFRGAIEPVDGGSVRAIQLKDVSAVSGIAWAGCMHTELPGKAPNEWLSAGDILFAARGSAFYAVLMDGEVASMPSVAAPQFFVLRRSSEAVLPAFLVWYLNQLPCQRYFQREAEGTMAKSIRRAVLEQTPVALPPLPQQQRLIALAATLHQERRVAEQLISNGEALQSALALDLHRQWAQAPLKDL